MNPYLALALIILAILGLRIIWVLFRAWNEGRLPEMKAKFHELWNDWYWRYRGS
jgi:hypothetical protein